MMRKNFKKTGLKGRAYKRKLAALFIAGMLTFTACGKAAEPNSPREVKNPINTIQTSGTGVTAPKGNSVNLSATVTRGQVGESTEAVEKEFIQNTANFAFELMKLLIKENAGENVMISPDSIITALGMTENGAGTTTLEEMRKILGGELTLEEYNKALSGFNKMLTDSSNVTFNSANSIWVRNTEEMEISKAFLQSVVDYYDSEFYIADFNNQTVDDINAWVNEKTNKMIPSVIDKLDEDAQMLLINAIAFEGEWADEYKESQIREGRQFNNAKGIKEEAVMLASSEEGLISLNGGVGFGKAYKGGQFEFVAILPPEGVGADEFINGISGEDFVNAYLNRDYDPMVYAEIPEFKYDYKTKLGDQLKDMGMEIAFSDYADFSGMLASGLPELKIAEVIHKTHIEVDRKGTKAAAVTVVEMEKCSAIREENPRKTVKVILDRPFVYAIVNSGTGLPVFLGTVNSVE